MKKFRVGYSVNFKKTIFIPVSGVEEAITVINTINTVQNYIFKSATSQLSPIITFEEKVSNCWQNWFDEGERDIFEHMEYISLQK